MRAPAFRSLLYSEPRLYDLVFPDAGETLATLVGHPPVLARDLADTMSTFAAHAHGGALLLADSLNARAYLDGFGGRSWTW